MRFAMLGYSREVVAWIDSGRGLGHQFVVAFDAADGREALRTACSDIEFRDDWESLFTATGIDAVLVAGPVFIDQVASDIRERRDDQLRKLIQAEVPLLVIPPACEAIVGYELEMIRKDVRGVVVPALALPLHPAWRDLSDFLLKSGPGLLGPIELISCKRYLPVRQRADVLTAFLSDIAALRGISGPLKRLTASGGVRIGEEKPTVGSVVVHVEGEFAFPVRWSVSSRHDSFSAVVTVAGSYDCVTLRIPVDPTQSWTLVGAGLDTRYEPLSLPALVFRQLVQSVDDRKPTALTWSDTCRDMEAMEAIDRSIVRARAIELSSEEHTEESSFKGIMAAGGCLMLFATLGVLVLGGIGAAFFQPAKGTGPVAWRWLQLLLFTPLALFLLFQLLGFGLSSHLKRRLDKGDAPQPDISSLPIN